MTDASTDFVPFLLWKSKNGEALTPNDFRAFRLRLGLTQAQMAEKLGYAHAQSISDIERGKLTPGKAVLLLLERMMEDAK